MYCPKERFCSHCRNRTNRRDCGWAVSRAATWPQLFKRWITLWTGLIPIQWITQLVSLILIRWIVIYPLDSTIRCLNSKNQGLAVSWQGSYVKWWRNLAASSGWRIQARDTMGWDELGSREKKKTTRKRCHEVESGQGELHGHNNNLCVLSRRWLWMHGVCVLYGRLGKTAVNSWTWKLN